MGGYMSDKTVGIILFYLMFSLLFGFFSAGYTAWVTNATYSFGVGSTLTQDDLAPGTAADFIATTTFRLYNNDTFYEFTCGNHTYGMMWESAADRITMTVHVPGYLGSVFGWVPVWEWAPMYPLHRGKVYYNNSIYPSEIIDDYVPSTQGGSSNRTAYFYRGPVRYGMGVWPLGSWGVSTSPTGMDVTVWFRPVWDDDMESSMAAGKVNVIVGIGQMNMKPDIWTFVNCYMGFYYGNYPQGFPEYVGYLLTLLQWVGIFALVMLIGNFLPDWL